MDGLLNENNDDVLQECNQKENEKEKKKKNN